MKQWLVGILTSQKPISQSATNQVTGSISATPPSFFSFSKWGKSMLTVLTLHCQSTFIFTPLSLSYFWEETLLTSMQSVVPVQFYSQLYFDHENTTIHVGFFMRDLRMSKVWPMYDNEKVNLKENKKDQLVKRSDGIYGDFMVSPRRIHPNNNISRVEQT